MPNLTTITVNDREATPVAHPFAPHSEKDGIAVFHESGSSLVGNKSLTISTRDTGSNVKVRVKFDLPVVQTETINGITADKVVRRSVADLVLTFPRSGTLQERKNLVGMLQNLLDAGQAAVDPVITGVETFY